MLFFNHKLMEILQTVIPPIAITVIVELGKQIGAIKSGWEKVSVFILAIMYAGLFYYSKEWAEIALTILGSGLAAIGAYEVGLKPIVKALNKNGNTPPIAPTSAA
jgi:hypothetical protein